MKNWKKGINLLFSFSLVFNNIYASNINIISNNDALKLPTNVKVSNEMKKVYNKKITASLKKKSKLVSHDKTNVYYQRDSSFSIEKNSNDIIKLRKNSLNKKELIANINERINFPTSTVSIPNKVGPMIKSLIGSDGTIKTISVIPINNDSTNTINLIDSKEEKAFIDITTKEKQEIYKDISLTKMVKDYKIKDVNYKCKNPNEYSLMEKIKIYPTKGNEYIINIKNKYIIDKKTKTKKISYSTDINGNKYTTKGNKLFKNGKEIGGYKYLQNSYTCVRYLSPNSNINVCENGFVLNNNGICEKKTTSVDFRRKNKYYTCKEPKNIKGTNSVLIKDAKMVDFKKSIKRTCDNLPKSNGIMYYKSNGYPVCINNYIDKKGEIKNKYYKLLNGKEVKSFKTASCKWATINNYKVGLDTLLSDKAIYTTTGKGNVDVPNLSIFKNGKKYAFVLLSSGEGKLDKDDGLKRTSTYGDSDDSVGTLYYKNYPFTYLVDTEKTAVGNGYDLFHIVDLVQNTNYSPTIHNDYEQQKNTIENFIDTNKLEGNLIYKYDIKNSRVEIYKSGYFTSDGKIYLTGEEFINEKGKKDKTEEGLDTLKTTWKDSSKETVVEVDDSGNVLDNNIYYFKDNIKLKDMIEKRTSFTKVVLQDTFVFKNRVQELIKKPSKKWNYKLYIYEINQFKKMIDYIKDTYYSNNKTFKKSFVFYDRKPAKNKCKKYEPKKGTCNGKPINFINNVSNVYEPTIEYSQAVCSNQNEGALLSDKCIVKTKLFQELLGKPKLLSASKNQCIALFKYDNTNSSIKKVLDKLMSKKNIINNLNNKYTNFTNDNGYNKKLNEIKIAIEKIQNDFKTVKKRIIKKIKKENDINTKEGKKILNKYRKNLKIQEEKIKSIKKDIEEKINKTKPYVDNGIIGKETKQTIRMGTFGNKKATNKQWGTKKGNNEYVYKTKTGDIRIKLYSKNPFQVYNEKTRGSIGTGIGSKNDGITPLDSVEVKLGMKNINKVEFKLSGLGGCFDKGSVCETKIEISAYNMDNKIIETQSRFRQSGSEEDTYTFETPVRASKFIIKSISKKMSNYVIKNIILSETRDGKVDTTKLNSLKKETETRKIQNINNLKDLNYKLLLNINNMIKEMDDNNIYDSEFEDLLNILIPMNSYMKEDFELLEKKYNKERNIEKYFIDDVFASYTKKGDKLVRTELGQNKKTVFDNVNTSVLKNLKSLTYNADCKIGNQIIDCNDKILNSNQVCELNEVESKTYCSNGYSYIGNGKCAKESCAPGFYFGTTTLGGNKYKGCIKVENGTKGCETDTIDTDERSINVKYSLKYIKNDKGDSVLKCASLPIFPEVKMKNVTVSATLAKTFGFDGHTKPTSLKINELNYKYNEENNSFDLKRIDGNMTVNSSESNDFYWVPGEKYLIWTTSNSNIQGMGEFICHDCKFNTTCNKCKKIISSLDKYKIKYDYIGGKTLKAPTGSDGHHSMHYITRYLSDNLFSDLKSSSLEMNFSCKDMDKGIMRMEPVNNKDKSVTKTLKDFDIKQIPSSKLPAWCVNTKDLDGCNNNNISYGNCIKKDGYIASDNGSNYCYLKRPTLNNSCEARLYEIPKKYNASCNILNGFHNIGGECKRITYSDAISNTDYYCTLIPSDFTPYGDKKFSENEAFKNIANNDKKILKSKKAMQFDIAIDKVTIKKPIEYEQNNVSKTLIHDKSVKEKTAYVDNYYKLEGDSYKKLMKPRVNVHKYIDKTYKYTNKDSKTKYRGFLLNKNKNDNFNYNISDEHFYYQKNLFNVHLEDETYEYNDNIESTTMDKRFGLIKNRYIDKTPFNIETNHKYECKYDYTLYKLPDCNQGVSDKSEYTISFDKSNNAFVCNKKPEVYCDKGEGTYDKNTNKCILTDSKITCPNEIIENGITYRKSMGEIIDGKINKNGSKKSISCQLKKIACDNYSIEAKCPAGFVYDKTVKGTTINGCVLKLPSETKQNISLLASTLNNNTKVEKVSICPTQELDKTKELFMKKINKKIGFNLIKGKCVRTEFDEILTTKKTIHGKYALTNSISVGENYGKNFNLITIENFKNNTTNKKVIDFVKEGYTIKNNINTLRIPIFVLPENTNEETVLSLTGAGKPSKIYAVNDKSVVFDEVLSIKGADIIKGFNDTQTKILNGILKNKPYLIVYEWNDVSKIKNKTINYFCDNATCVIPSMKDFKMEKLNKTKSTFFTTNISKMIDDKKLKNKIINNILYNNCFSSEVSYQSENNKIPYCYNADIQVEPIIKNKIKIISNNKGLFRIKGNEIRSNIIFEQNKKQNYVCDIKKGWNLKTKTYEFLDGTKQNYNICSKIVTSNKNKTKIDLVKEINLDGTKYESVIISEPTDNKCYTAKVYVENINNSNSSSLFSMFNGVKTIKGKESKPLKNFVLNWNNLKINVDKILKTNIDLGFDNYNKKPYYCINVDNKMLNSAEQASVVFYKDLNNILKKGTKNRSINNDIKLYDNTEKVLGKKPYELVSWEKPEILTGVIIKDKNNKPPILNGKQNNINILKESKNANGKYIDTNKNGYINFVKLKDMNLNNREICFVFDLSRGNKYMNNGKVKSKYLIKKVKETPFTSYLVTMDKCSDYIEPVDFDKIKQLEDDIKNLQLKPDFNTNQSLKDKVEENKENIRLLKEIQLVDSKKLNKLQQVDFNKCAVEIKCMSGYKFNKSLNQCVLKTTYKPNKYKYTEDYMIDTPNGVDTITIEVDKLNNDKLNIAKLKDATKIQGSFKSILICDDNTKPVGGLCSVTKTIKAECKQPIYSNELFLNYNLYKGSAIQSSSNDSYICTFEKPKHISLLTGAMPQIEIVDNK